MLSICRITIIIFVVNIVLISYTAYVFYFQFNSKSLDIRIAKNSNRYSFETQSYLNLNEIKVQTNSHSFNSSDVLSVEIWSKASIGVYLWQHILRGHIESRLEGDAYSSGSLKTNRFKLKFRSGPLLTTDSLQHLTTQNLILVLNGRDKQKISFATDWIKAVERVRDRVKNVGLVVLGDEQCYNNWIKPYLQTNGGFVKFLFIVYDWKGIDNKVIYQWPLGVATYRQFPDPEVKQLNLGTTRPYVCNLVSTIYPDSSRLELLNILTEKYQNICIIKTRFEWTPKETIDSLNFYVEALRLSDLTLSPIGMNHECYRIFEAISYGSVPVIEENMNHVLKSSCDNRSAYRLLKELNAPFIWVHNWTEQLPHILHREMNLSLEYKIERRFRVIKWYSKFKTIIKNRFLKVINDSFV